MGRVPKSHSTKSTFSNKDLVWRSKIHHGRQNKVTIQFAYVPYVYILEFLEGEGGDTSTSMESLLEILSFATCLMQLKNVACNYTCCM